MFRDLIRGAVAGTIATWLMDQVTTTLYEGQSKAVRAREQAARPDGKTSTELMLDQIEQTADVELNDSQRSLALQLIHYSLGAIPGALYVFARERIPGVGAARGLLYGALLFLINDEWLNWRLGFAGAPGDYPTETHLRGLVGHLVLGGTTDVLADVL
jgi:uncharacterized membrane protein YagU involved in acid resistance